MVSPKLNIFIFLVLLILPFYNSGNIDFRINYIDSIVNNIVWCGNNNESILILTEISSVYKSDDKGFSWKLLNEVIVKTGKNELLEDENQVNNSITLFNNILIQQDRKSF